MKKILSIVTIAVLIAACNQSPKTNMDATKATTVDTAGLSQFQAWKAQNELANPNDYYGNATAYAGTAPRATTPASKTATHRSVKNESGSVSSQSSYPAKAAQKKGWSKAAKGAAIGAGTGAVAGAVINKRNRVAGAVIGGVLGGGVGYGIGRGMDKKDGRY